jgi:hypothetical protein
LRNAHRGVGRQARAPSHRHQFGDVVVRPDGDLYGDGVNVAARLEPLAAPGGILVSAKVHDELHGKLALAWHDRGEQALKNIARPVRVYAFGGEAGGRTPSAAQPAPFSASEPSIAVLPFSNISGDPEQEDFADGVVEDVITALSRVRWLFVIARNNAQFESALQKARKQPGAAHVEILLALRPKSSHVGLLFFNIRPVVPHPIKRM